MSLTGLVLQFVYRLQRHVRFSQPLARWLGLGLLVLAGWSLFRWWPTGWQAALLVGLFLGYLLVMGWAARSGYVRFMAGPAPEETTEPAPPLGPEEPVAVRASGWFTVNGQDRYFVDVQAAVETVRTREHIVAGLIRPSRFLLLGQWPKRDTGWWYIFFRPSTIREVRAGRLTFGARSRQALRIVHAAEGDTVRTITLAFDDPVALRRVWADLLVDAGE